MKKRVALLGATGSIGHNSLDIISRNKDVFELTLLSSHSNGDELERLKKQFPGAVCVLTGGKDGKKKLIDAIGSVQPDITINGISGSAGLEPSVAAIKAGSNLALANKETIVMAGKFVLRLAKEKKVKIIPVDSEHSAIFHLIEANAKQDADKISQIILTASGGPFKNLSAEEMEKVTVKDALAHPTWKMGPKITVDSASMANKGLEIIEACSLFNIKSEKINVVIHPQSIVHSMIQLYNGVFYAQLSKPDMRHPIHDALFYPEISPLDIGKLDFNSLSIDFEKPDLVKFPMLKLGFLAAEYSALYPCAYNAANEEAVSAFLKEEIGFSDIPKITAAVLEKDWEIGCGDIETVLKTDAKARLEAVKIIKKKR